MITLLWVQITGLPLHGALAGADGAASALPPESAGFYQDFYFRNRDVRAGTSGDATRKYSEG